ncbi:hypothetical protein RvY_11653 [Ramazzottius varieornatus]|uniref:Uncharacterized protein n=1 Tax=Ramazzottius varieornatus TaxID=947166 RepID=A0A1D1VPK1_RAMVA|nr:hypothetical protein RvY_11653 [Ramazzottius varieornatus]
MEDDQRGQCEINSGKANIQSARSRIRALTSRRLICQLQRTRLEQQYNWLTDVIILIALRRTPPASQSSDLSSQQSSRTSPRRTRITSSHRTVKQHVLLRLNQHLERYSSSANPPNPENYCAVELENAGIIPFGQSDVMIIRHI